MDGPYCRDMTVAGLVTHAYRFGINQQSTGRTAFDVDIDGMEEQPWRHPGVDIADFFNYGFTEDSWRVYCEKQLRYIGVVASESPFHSCRRSSELPPPPA